MSILSNVNYPKNTPKYSCKKCHFYTSNKKDFNRHIETIKHKSIDCQCFSIILPQKTPKNPKPFTCNCGKEYNDSSGLWRHNKKYECSKNVPDNVATSNEVKLKNENENENIDKDIVIIPFTDKFKIKWNEWIEYKRDQHKFKYKSIKTEQTSIDQLIKLSNNKEESAIEIINTSIANGWKGFFELKNNKNETNRLNSEQKFDAYKQYSSRFS